MANFYFQKEIMHQSYDKNLSVEVVDKEPYLGTHFNGNSKAENLQTFYCVYSQRNIFL